MKYTIKSFEIIAQDALTGTEIDDYRLPDHIFRLLKDMFSPGTLNFDTFQVKCLIKATRDYNVKLLVNMNTVEQGNVYCCMMPELYHVAIITSGVIHKLCYKAEEYLNLKLLARGKEHWCVSLFFHYIIVGNKAEISYVVEYTDIIESEAKMIQAIQNINLSYSDV